MSSPTGVNLRSFPIYDLADYFGDSRTGFYADDTTLCYVSVSPIYLALTLGIELKIVGEWLRADKLTLNISETKEIMVGSRHKLSTKVQGINFGNLGTNIERVTDFDYFGLILDHFLDFIEHIEYLVTEAS